MSTEAVVPDGRQFGGYQQCADALSGLAGKPVSRQQVYMWWSRRAQTGFPLGWERPSYNGATRIREFSLAEVVDWWREKHAAR